jgi:WXG100 family type VII secretion target
MAASVSIQLDPSQMEKRAKEFETSKDEFDKVVESMKTLVTSLSEEWVGQSSSAFADQFIALEPSFSATSELIADIAQQLREISSAMQNMDQQIANKISAK